jgi:hypothetical protein
MVKAPDISQVARSPAALGALAVNLLPIGMVLFGGWSLGALVVLYWLENVVVGAVSVLRLAVTAGAMSAAGFGGGLFTIPSFFLHYGMFCFVHGIL